MWKLEVLWYRIVKDHLIHDLHLIQFFKAPNDNLNSTAYYNFLKSCMVINMWQPLDYCVQFVILSFILNSMVKLFCIILFVKCVHHLLPLYIICKGNRGIAESNVSSNFRRLFNEWIIFLLGKMIKYSVQYVLNILCSFSELCLANVNYRLQRYFYLFKLVSCVLTK